MAHFLITEESGIPLIGSLYFGIIDRGTSLLQVRPSCGCNLNCPFCSVDAGPATKTRATSYEVEMEYLLGAVQEIARFKGCDDLLIEQGAVSLDRDGSYFINLPESRHEFR
jgi:uncharacterized protein